MRRHCRTPSFRSPVRNLGFDGIVTINRRPKLTILITGHSGFIGQALVLSLASRDLRLVGRRVLDHQTNVFFKKELTSTENYTDSLAGVLTVIHTAARAHIMEDESTDPLTEYRKVNVDGTLNLARQAADAGVKRFIFISSIKVNGEQTQAGFRFNATDIPEPEDPYGVSKFEAEQVLLTLAQNTQMEVVIIRSPLVYGPGVKGNFANMINVVKKGIPLPLGAIHNRRSLVALDNLVDLIVTCIDHPLAANQVFLAADGQDLSTTELLKGLAKAMGQPSRLIPVPCCLLTLGANMLGKKTIAQKILGSLQVDISKAQDSLGWNPPLSVEEGLKRCFVHK